MSFIRTATPHRRVLVTGGCGFVGCNLIEALAIRGYDAISVLDDESTGSRHHLSRTVDLTVADIKNLDAVDEAARKADVVIHLAADTRVMDSLLDPQANFATNVIGTFSLLEAMRRHGKTRIINASTGGAIVGDAPPPVHEQMVPRPLSPYGASKLAVEGYLSAYAGGYGLTPVSFRFANVYGPLSFHKGSVVAAFFKNVLAGEPITVYGDGSQTRDFVFVGDLVETVADAVEHDVVGVFQLGSGVPTSVNALLSEMSAVTGEDLVKQVNYVPARAGEVHYTYCDVSLAQAELAFAPSTSLREGLTATWNWFQGR